MTVSKGNIAAKYASYFHDGSILAIEHRGADIIILMESAELWPEDFEGDVALTDAGTIKGRLHLRGVRSVQMNERPLTSPLKMLAESSRILDLDFEGASVRFFVEWTNYSKAALIEEYSDIVIVADTIVWENDPHICGSSNA